MGYRVFLHQSIYLFSQTNKKEHAKLYARKQAGSMGGRPQTDHLHGQGTASSVKL